MIGKFVRVIVDRSMGSCHPDYPDHIYPLNYGYVEGIMAADGEEQDAYILGVNRPLKDFEGRVIAIIKRADDLEEKWVVALEGMTFTPEGIEEAVYFQEKFYKSEIIV